ncbi:MAG: ATP-binding protein [Oscillospiraceae bacterium]|nr:ATP-binding protein [Oscillospiraceae bacterium]
MDIDTLRISLQSVCAYRDVMEQPVMAQAQALLDGLCRERGEEAAGAYARLFYLLQSERCAGLGDWLGRQLRYSQSPYPLLAEREGVNPALEAAARRDVEIFSALARLDCDRLAAQIAALLPRDVRGGLSGLPRWKAGANFDFDSLTTFYRQHGTGLFAQYRAFIWEKGQLLPVREPDAPEPGELLGYEAQRRAVWDNTRALLRGRPVNNVLLYGDSGTGKSATVKSLLAAPGFEELRIVELQKEGLGDMAQLLRLLDRRRQKFILFIDDLAFDQDDRTYSLLKTILEGGLERRPANIAIYATSNRRQLVRQTLSDRQGDEMDATETIQEKTALADRFGLRVAFLPLNKAEFLALVDGLAEQEGLQVPREQLHQQALQWELRHPGRTPRGARQFLSSLSRKD